MMSTIFSFQYTLIVILNDWMPFILTPSLMGLSVIMLIYKDKLISNKIFSKTFDQILKKKYIYAYLIISITLLFLFPQGFFTDRLIPLLLVFICLVLTFIVGKIKFLHRLQSQITKIIDLLIFIANVIFLILFNLEMRSLFVFIICLPILTQIVFRQIKTIQVVEHKNNLIRFAISALTFLFWTIGTTGWYGSYEYELFKSGGAEENGHIYAFTGEDYLNDGTSGYINGFIDIDAQPYYRQYAYDVITAIIFLNLTQASLVVWLDRQSKKSK